jgi:hypothetical protein
MNLERAEVYLTEKDVGKTVKMSSGGDGLILSCEYLNLAQAFVFEVKYSKTIKVMGQEKTFSVKEMFSNTGKMLLGDDRILEAF